MFKLKSHGTKARLILKYDLDLNHMALKVGLDLGHMALNPKNIISFWVQPLQFVHFKFQLYFHVFFLF